MNRAELSEFQNAVYDLFNFRTNNQSPFTNKEIRLAHHLSKDMKLNPKQNEVLDPQKVIKTYLDEGNLKKLPRICQALSDLGFKEEIDAILRGIPRPGKEPSQVVVHLRPGEGPRQRAGGDTPMGPVRVEGTETSRTEELVRVGESGGGEPDRGKTGEGVQADQGVVGPDLPSGSSSGGGQ